MGWEYHNRRRRNGQFVSDAVFSMSPPAMDQIHLRCPYALAQRIRTAARKEPSELTAWILDACRQKLGDANRAR